MKPISPQRLIHLADDAPETQCRLGSAKLVAIEILKEIENLPFVFCTISAGANEVVEVDRWSLRDFPRVANIWGQSCELFSSLLAEGVPPLAVCCASSVISSSRN